MSNFFGDKVNAFYQTYPCCKKSQDMKHLGEQHTNARYSSKPAMPRYKTDFPEYLQVLKLRHLHIPANINYL